MRQLFLREASIVYCIYHILCMIVFVDAIIWVIERQSRAIIFGTRGSSGVMHRLAGLYLT